MDAIKHSGTRKIDVTLRGGVDHIELIVRDLGAGFEVSTTEGRGLGLTSMKEHHNSRECAFGPGGSEDAKSHSV